MARISFTLSPAATSAAVTKKVRPSKQVKPASLFAKSRRKIRNRRNPISYLPKRQRVFKWLRHTYLDFLKMIIFFGAASGLRWYTPLFRHHEYTWPMWRDNSTGLWVGPESISRPSYPNILPNLAAAIILSLSPMSILLFMQIFVRNFWDFNAGLMGLLTAVDIMTLIQLPLKVLFPSPRPSFLQVCKPEQGELNKIWEGNDLWKGNSELKHSIPLYMNITHCLNGNDTRNETRKDELRYQMDAFPSGTTGNAFAVGCFLALYLNAKLKAYSTNRTPFWKMLAVMAPLFGALMMSLLPLLMNASSPIIVFISAAIGTAAAFIGYRTHFHAVLDHRQNHLPFMQGPDKPRSGLPLHHLHLPAAIQNHLPSHIHAPHLHLHMPYIFHHRSAEQKRLDEENRWLAVNFHWPGLHGKKGRKRKRRGRKRRRSSPEDAGVMMAHAIAEGVMDFGGGTTDAALGAALA